MLIKLTNAFKDFKGQTLLINTDFIMSVYPKTNADGDAVTVLYSHTNDSWEVKQTIEEVWTMVNSSN